MPPLDITRFRLDPPPQTKRGDAAAWRAALENANSQLEHQLNRIANLELLLKFGPNTWRAQSQLSAAAGKQFEAQLTDMRKQVGDAVQSVAAPADKAVPRLLCNGAAACRPISNPLIGTYRSVPDAPPPGSQIDALNRERKVQQMAAGMELRRLEDEWANAVRKNLEISLACEKLEEEVRLVHAQLPEEERRRLDGEAAAAAAGQQQQDGGGGAGSGSNGMANGQHGDGPEPMDE
jgi:pre-mRNA-splicing factor SPF27